MRLVGRAPRLERARRLAVARKRSSRRSSARRCAASSPGEAGRIAVLDLLRARTRRFEIVFVLGLEEGSLPRRGHESPFLGDDARRELDERSRARLTRPDQVARDRYLFYTACTRASRRLYLVREAATDEGSPREPSPFWDEVQAVFPKDDVARWTRRRPLSALTWPLEDAPTERERLRAVALRAADDARAADAIATANGWDRRLDRALRAFERPTRLTHPQVLAELAREVDLRRHRARAVRRLLLDLVHRASDRSEEHRRARSTRGCAARSRTRRCSASTPACRRSSAPSASSRIASRTRSRSCGSCLDDALRGRAARAHRSAGARAPARPVARPRGVRPRRGRGRHAARPAPLRGARSAPSARRRSCSAGSSSPRASTLSGKIDRIDVDPFSARGIVQDYKSGKNAHSAAADRVGDAPPDPALHARPARPRRDRAARRSLPAALRRAEGARAAARRGAARTACPASRRTTTSTRTRSGAGRARARARRRDRRADPRRATCGTTRRAATVPTWCELWSMCRVRRA